MSANKTTEKGIEGGDVGTHDNPPLIPSWRFGKPGERAHLLYITQPAHTPTTKHRVVNLDIPPSRGGGSWGGSRSLPTGPKANKRDKSFLRSKKHVKTSKKKKKTLFFSTKMFVD